MPRGTGDRVGEYFSHGMAYRPPLPQSESLLNRLDEWTGRSFANSSKTHCEQGFPVPGAQPRTSSAAVRNVAASPEINSVVTIDSRQRSRSSRIFSRGPINAN